MNTESQKSVTAQSEESILEFWNKEQIFKKSLEKESPLGNFVFYDGPPFATGLPHYGHLLPGTMKDVIPRYKTMQGYHVARRWGWDCHGLPIENLIEKELGLANKRDIEEFGIGKFNEAARNAVLRHEKDWKQYVPRSGRWVDMDDPYMSMQSSYMQSVWWNFSELHKKGLTKQGFMPMHLCPRCETTLANFEVNQGYLDVTDISLTAEFELVDERGTYLLAWTTTPWTLPANVALALGSNIQYSKIQCEDKKFIIAQSLVQKVCEGKDYEIIESLTGSDLVGRSYTPVFDYYQKQNLEYGENGWKIYEAEFVTDEDGTGIVHIAPAFGSDDMELAKKHNLPWVQHVSRGGRFIDDFAETTEGKTFKDMLVKQKDDLMTIDIEIIKYLANRGTLFSKKKIVHSYPHCWRCDTPLLNYATSSWFIDVPSIKDRLMELNTKVNWVPDHVGSGRFGKWLEGARDWALSRSRFWGTPLPVWNNESGTKTVVVSSIEDLLSKIKHSGNTYIGIRHGQSQSNLTGEINAEIKTENGLTELGKQQALKEAQNLASQNIDYIFVSPLQRTMETVEIIKQELALSDDQIIVDERLKERNPGAQWEGKQWLDAHNQEEAEDPKDFWNYRLADDAESISNVYQRIMDFMFDIESRYENKKIVVASHGGVLKTIEFAIKYSGDISQAYEFYQTESIPHNAEILKLDFKPFPYREGFVLDLHRPYIDQVKLLSDDGEELSLLGDVFDVWFDSASMPYAQASYPFINKDEFIGKHFPAQFIAEGLDQTRGWFYVMSVLGTALFDTIPFQNVIVNGLVLAEDGKKMSKRLKNYPDLSYMFDSAGADAVRLYLMSSPAVRAEEVAFSEKGVKEVSSKVMGRARNIMSLYQTYQDDVEHQALSSSDHVLDRWIMAELDVLIAQMTEGLDSFELDKAARPLFTFLDHFSTWYVRRSRDRYKEGNTKDTQKALGTTRMVLQTLSQLMAPFVPFVAEELWQNLRERDKSLEESVHLSSWPKLNQEPQNNIISQMAEVRELISQALQLRSESGIKVRQALSSLRLNIENISKEYHELILDELNVKELIQAQEMSLDTEITPELQAEGNARELLRQIQSIRKDMGLQAHDMVIMTVQTNEQGQSLIHDFNDQISKTAGLKDIIFAENKGQEIKVEELGFVVSIEK